MQNKIVPKIIGSAKDRFMGPGENDLSARARKRGIYLLPSMFTLANMAAGLYSILSSMNKNFGIAATAIIIAHVFDIFDGRVARWTKTESKFGIEFDSLADWISFGIAPSVLMYALVLKENKVWGMPIAMLFVICGALRLAKFNLKAHSVEAQAPYFIGLPIPAAGGMLAVFALLYNIMELGKPVRTINVVMKQIPYFYEFIPAIMFILSLLMVSQVQYSNFKSIRLLQARTMRSFVFMVLVIFMIYAYPQNTIFILYVTYILWGLGEYMWRTYNLRRKAVLKQDTTNKPG